MTPLNAFEGRFLNSMTPLNAFEGLLLYCLFTILPIKILFTHGCYMV
jgi:hypothetical protein